MELAKIFKLSSSAAQHLTSDCPVKGNTPSRKLLFKSKRRFRRITAVSRIS